MRLNGVTGICFTKLDVLDTLDELKICISYESNGETLESLPLNAENIEHCQPNYISLPGWKSSTVGATEFDQLPENAKNYIKKVEELLEVPIDIISTGPERSENVIRVNIF